MRELLDIVRKDTDLWQAHPILDTLEDDFRINSLLRHRRLVETSLLAFRNDLMEVSLRLRHHAASGTWAIRGYIIHNVPIHHRDLWPARLRKRYISTDRAYNQWAEASITAHSSLLDLCIDLFDIRWNGSAFDAGQYFTIRRGTSVFGGNCYPLDLPPTMAARLFRSELALAQACMLWLFAEEYRGMLPRPIDGNTIRPVLEASCRRLFSVQPGQMLIRRVQGLTELHWQVVRWAEEEYEKVANGGQPEMTGGPPKKVVDFTLPRGCGTATELAKTLEQGDIDGALRIIRRHLALYPRRVYFRRELAEIYLWLGQPSKALPEFGRLADLYLDCEDEGSALTVLEQMHGIAPGHPLIHLRKGDAHAVAGRAVRASGEYQAAGRKFLAEGDLDGLERMRQRLAKLWWGVLPSIQNVSAVGMLCLDFERDFDFYDFYVYGRQDKPGFRRVNEYLSREHRPLPPIAFESLLTVRALKKLARRCERAGQSRKRAAIVEKMSEIYSRYDCRQKAVDCFIVAMELRPERSPYCLEKMAELYLEQDHKERAAATFEALAEYHRRRNDTERVALAEWRAELISGKGRLAESDDFGFDDPRPDAMGFEFGKVDYDDFGSSVFSSGGFLFARD